MKIRKCAKCDGTGVRLISLGDVPNHFSEIPCEHCDGRGYLPVSSSSHSHVFKPVWKDFEKAIKEDLALQEPKVRSK